MVEVYDNKIYVIRYGDEIRVKRIFKRRGEKILLRSDNQAFPEDHGRTPCSYSHVAGNIGERQSYPCQIEFDLLHLAS